jgi:hypothetical protein
MSAIVAKTNVLYFGKKDITLPVHAKGYEAVRSEAVRVYSLLKMRR